MSYRVAAFFASGLSLAVLNHIGVYYSLYWYYSWFDLVTHTLGGLFVVVTIGVFTRSGWLPETVTKPLVLSVLLGAVMVVWEFYELMIGTSNPQVPEFFPDTIMDICMGAFGGLIGYMVLRLDNHTKQT